MTVAACAAQIWAKLTATVASYKDRAGTDLSALSLPDLVDLVLESRTLEAIVPRTLQHLPCAAAAATGTTATAAPPTPRSPPTTGTCARW